MPASRPSNIYQKLVIDVDLNDSVEQLKKKVHQIEGYSVHQQALYLNKSIELQDQRHLREYELKDGCEIEVFIKPILTPKHSGRANTKSATNAKKLKVIVLAKCGTKKLVVEVNPLDKVQVLRNELDERHQGADFQLPSEGYFFIYKQNVMEEKETFQWHNVRQGDTIEIFNGSVSGGS
uniref:Ubiquitin-like domain-containing protein n=1 Tax=Chenopodium quinoa TaxID=63459 RepID=A0A803LY71_CHEQI